MAVTSNNRDVRDLDESLPYGQYEYVDVVFNATANANTEVRHTLKPPTPELVDYTVVGYKFTSAPGTVPVIYRDNSATRRPWGRGYIVLRSNVSSLNATLLLTVRRSP